MSFSERFRVTSAEARGEGFFVTAIPEAEDGTGAYLHSGSVTLHLREEGQSRPPEAGMILILSGSFFLLEELGNVGGAEEAVVSFIDGSAPGAVPDEPGPARPGTL